MQPIYFGSPQGPGGSKCADRVFRVKLFLFLERLLDAGADFLANHGDHVFGAGAWLEDFLDTNGF